MKSRKLSSDVLKTSVITVLTGGIGWLFYEIRKTNYILNHIFDSQLLDNLITRTLDATRCSYIYINEEKYSNSFFFNIWKTFNVLYSYKLLNMTQCDNRQYRLRAVRSLGSIHGLEDWDCERIAWICDARTAVGLARTDNVDQRLFTKPPINYMYPRMENLLKNIQNFILTIDSNSKHPCLSYSVERVFQDESKIIDNDSTSLEVHKGIQNATNILIYCLNSILHHTTVKDNAKDIVKYNGLPLLMEVHRKFPNNDDISKLLVKIISNISIHTEYLDDFHQSGWIGILAKWVRNSDFLLSAHAAQALANLDIDGRNDGKYSQKVYLLHPMFRKIQSSEIDIVLVHGLLGGVFYTWRQRDSYMKSQNEDNVINNLNEHIEIDDHSTEYFFKDLNEDKKDEWEAVNKKYQIILYDSPEFERRGDTDLTSSFLVQDPFIELQNQKYSQCWPKDWLPMDCNKLRIVGVNYDTSLSLWAPVCPAEKLKRTLNERSEEIMNQLLMAGVGKRPIVWVTHSMGGLLVKNILVKAKESNNGIIKNLCKYTKGIVFYSTPHLGTKLAAIKQPTAMVLWPSVEVQELREKSPILLQLHEKFLKLIEEFPMKIISFSETKSTLVSPMKFNFMFVDKISADPGIGEFYEIPQDHLSICKPANRNSFLYQKVVNLINNTKTNFDNKNV